MAAARAGRRTLLISTDPAPSVGDALRHPLTATPRIVKGTSGRLRALEVHAAKALARWLGGRLPTLETIVLRGTWLDADDVGALLRLSLPGIDEVAALIEIRRLGRTGSYDLVVVDTAPTGHTLRMLAMPELLRLLAVVFDRMQHKHRAMVAALRGRWIADESDALIADLDEHGRDLVELLRDRKRTAMSWVTIPEPMAAAETADALVQLRRLGVPVDTLVINRLTPAPDRPCRWCQARRAFERAAVKTLLAACVDDLTRVETIQSRATEPRGVAALAAIAREMGAPSRLSRERAKPVGSVMSVGTPRGPAASVPGDGLSLLMFGGKGGVGKTTCAAAAALGAAAERPRCRVLLVSVDPAHSLADVLGTPLGDVPRSIPGAPPNLTARELDSAARFERIKSRYASAIDALFDRLVRGTAVDVAADRQAMRDLIELAPPGLDELMAIVEVSDALEPTAQKQGVPGSLVVLDTAPSGHALRLLEMPAIVHDWVKALMSILLKYRPLVGVGELGAVLLQMSQGLGRLRALLADSSRTAFVAVTRPASLPVLETARLVERLHALDIPVPVVVVNAVGAGTCGRCETSRREQRRALTSARKTVGRGRRSLGFVVTPAVVPPPAGPRMLRKWRRTWTAA